VLEGADRGLVDHRVVHGAGHFSFLSPFPADMISPDVPPSHDPPGFDGRAFHEAMVPDVQRFLQVQLAVA
jgi:hypothetical protein